MPLPPGPKQPALIQTLHWSFDPLPFLDQCAARYGSMFTIRLASLGEFVMLTEPAHIKQVFTADAATLEAGRVNRLLEPLVGPTSILVLDGQTHLRQRRLLLPPFHGERMHAYAKIMRGITEASLDRWPLSQAFSVHPFVQSITLDVILRAVFGLAEGAAMRELAELLVELFTPPPALLAFLPLIQLDVPLSPFRKFLRLRERVDQRLYALIAERRRAPDLAERSDILSLMLAARDENGQPMSDLELRDELVTMIAAGHETTATTLAWALGQVLAAPAVHARLREEAQSVLQGESLDAERLNRLEYTDAVIKETLRLRPILPIVARHVSAPFSVGGYDLPVGSNVAPCIYLTHRRPDLYPEPERFLPERFLGKKLDPYEWLPFGGGLRRCLGMAFALFEAKIVLATVMARAELRRAEPTPLRPVRRGITLAPDHGTRLVLARRTPRPRTAESAATA
ncbi:MAG TPA: cytochrome P450 [Polyangia bacterium]|jgi:cytochrome P450|nr:cytochrome P450 [Polyangia bacterium]